MRRDLTEAELASLTARGHVVQAKVGAPAVIAHIDPDGEHVTKLWSRRERVSSDWLYPYAERFRRNAARLRSRGVNAPIVTSYGRIIGTNQRYVTYRRVPGDALRSGAIDVPGFASFVAMLHARGIYFRSLHLGNVLKAGDGYALIDVTDVDFRRDPLSVSMRARNLSFLLSYPNDTALLGGRDTFISAYRAATGYDDAMTATLERDMARSLASRPSR